VRARPSAYNVDRRRASRARGWVVAIERVEAAERPEAAERARYLFSVDEYERMGEAGIFPPECRVELIEGEIVLMNPINEPHSGTVNWLVGFFSEALGRTVVVSVQNPIRIRPRNEPRPDLALLRPRADYYRNGHPSLGDVLLAIEVADSTLAYDTRVKVPMYARAGIPEVWVVDVNRPAILVYREPTPEGYAETRAYRPGEVVSPLAFPELAIGVSDVVG
jgi:Uma2 family endonuclease